jgi:integrase
MASVIHDKKARTWRVRWRDGGRGSPHRSSERFKTKGEALAFLEAIEAKQTAAGPAPVVRLAPLTWTELTARWLKAQESAGSSFRHLEECRRSLARHTTTWRTAADATPEAMATLSMGAGKTVRAILSWAQLHLSLTVDPRILAIRQTRRRVKAPERDLLPDHQVLALIDAATAKSPADGALCHLLATYGHRAESLVRLTTDALALDTAPPTITVTVKGGHVVRHPLLPATVAILRPVWAHARAHQQPAATGRPYLFAHTHLGRPYRTGHEFASWFQHRIGTGFNGPGTSIGYYDAFKRWAISRMLEAGLDPKTIASITGHKTVSLILNRYARTNESRQTAALAALAALPMAPGVPGVCPAAPGVPTTSGCK